jgi:hypothetical protein
MLMKTYNGIGMVALKSVFVATLQFVDRTSNQVIPITVKQQLGEETIRKIMIITKIGSIVLSKNRRPSDSPQGLVVEAI